MVIMVSHNGNIFGIAPCRYSARSALRPAAVGIRPLLGSFHWSAFGRSAFRHAPWPNRPMSSAACRHHTPISHTRTSPHSPNTTTHCAYPQRDAQAELTWVTGYIPRWFNYPQTIQLLTRQQMAGIWTCNPLITTLQVWCHNLMLPSHHVKCKIDMNMWFCFWVGYKIKVQLLQCYEEEILWIVECLQYVFMFNAYGKLIVLM